MKRLVPFLIPHHSFGASGASGGAGVMGRATVLLNRCAGGVFPKVTAEVTGESVELSVIAAVTVRLNCSESVLVVTPVAFGLP